MIIRSNRPESNFYLLDKSISEDKKLSWAARGLLIFLLGKPDSWRVSAEYLAQQTNDSGKKTGKQGVYSLLNELIDAGYVLRSENQAHDNNTGHLLGYDYTVYDTPCKAEPYKAQPCKAQPYKAQPCKANHPLISIDTKQGLNKASIDTKQGLNTVSAEREKTTFNVADLVLLGVDEQVAKDWLLIRKTKRAPLTTASINAIKREAENAGITINEAITICAENSWQSFKADWIKPKSNNKTRPDNFAEKDYQKGINEDGSF